MPGTITLNIPLNPHLTKYLTKKYGNTHRVSRKSWLGRYLIDLLDKKYRKSNVNISKDSFYQVSVPPSIIKEVGFELSPLKIKSLSDMIHKIFINDLYSYIEVSVGSELKFYNEDFDSINKQNTLRAINQFLKFYDITEDEISVDSIYRNFHREQKKDKCEKVKSTEVI